MGRLARSWDLVGKSFEVLLSDKELLLLPVFSGISCLIVSVMTLGGGALLFRSELGVFVGTHPPTVPQGMWAFLFFFYLLNYFIVVFFNVALVSAASDRFAGGNATVNHGLQVAWDRKGSILQWAVLAATVGILLNLLEERLGWLGRLVAGFIGVAWNMATFFVVPLLAAEDIGPIEALYRSADIFTATWGEELVGGFSFGVIFTLLAIPGFLLPILLARPLGATGVLVGFIVALAYWLLLSIISSAVRGIFMAALYRYATTSEVSTNFNRDDFSTAWQPRR
jgi:xanthosine utilization system XapX-like protein